jgi:hypothetical protein
MEYSGIMNGQHRLLKYLLSFRAHVKNKIERAQRKGSLEKKIHLQCLYYKIEEDIEDLETKIEESEWKAFDGVLV